MTSTTSKGDLVESSSRPQPVSRDTGGTVSMVPSNLSDWNSAVPKLVVHADSLGPAAVKKFWEAIYNEAGLKAASESERKAVRGLFYVYGALNGTSRAGDYTGYATTNGGTIVEVAILPRIVGKFSIRKFFRGNMEESYHFFKVTGVMETYPRFLAKAATYGASHDTAFAIADWLSDCPLFTPAELAVHRNAFVISIDRSRRARDGHTLEDVEQKSNKEEVQVNGRSGRDDDSNVKSW